MLSEMGWHTQYAQLLTLQLIQRERLTIILSTYYNIKMSLIIDLDNYIQDLAV